MAASKGSVFVADQKRNGQDLLNELANLLENSASQSITDEKYAEGLIKAHAQVIERNILLTNLLKNYIESHSEKNEMNKKFKKILFYTFVLAFILFTGAVIVVFIKTDLNEATVPLVVSLLSVGATYIGSIFIAYEIMFRYLFPADEEKDMISMIKTVIENDLKVEEFASLQLADHAKKTSDTRGQDENSSG